jgi:hypothetical protein
MKKLSVSQLIGPVALFIAVAGAEASSYGLSRMPSSEWMWYLNLKWFSMFQQSHYTLQDRLGIEGLGFEQLLLIALPLLLAAFLGYRLRQSLLLAISSNLSFVYIGFVFLTWARAKSFVQTASLSGRYAASPSIWSNPDLIILIVLVSLSLFSFLVSHLSYIQRARAAF